MDLADGTTTPCITLTDGAQACVPRSDAGQCLAAIERHGVTAARFVPTMLRMPPDHPDGQTRRPDSLRMIQNGTAPIRDETPRQATTWRPSCRCLHGDGMTEVSSIATRLPAKHATLAGTMTDKRRACGPVGVLSDPGLVDAEARPVPPVGVGEIVLRDPNRMTGDRRRPAATAAAPRGGSMHSGNLGQPDDEGFLRTLGRLKDRTGPAAGTSMPSRCPGRARRRCARAATTS